MVQVQTGNMLDVVVEGKSIGLKPRSGKDVLWLPKPEGLRDVLAAEVERLNSEQKRKAQYPDMTERFKQLDQRHEQRRLEREVIRAAKALVALYADESRRDKGEELGDLIETVGALNKFESQHGI